MKAPKLIAGIVLIGMASTSCKKNNEPAPVPPPASTSVPPPVPVISGFAPAYGLSGTTVTIAGTDLSGSNLSFKVNGVLASLLPGGTSAQIQIVIPATATSGKITIEDTSLSNPVIFTSTTDFDVLADIPRTGLIAFYPFSGNANDASGNNLNGTLNNGPVLSIDRFGSANHTYVFDGVDDYIDMGNPTQLQITTTITMSAWINIKNFKTSSQSILSKLLDGYPSSTSRGYVLSQDFDPFSEPSEPIFSFSAFSSSYGTFYGGGTTALTTNTWVHATLIIDNNTTRFYRNGVLTEHPSYGATLLEDGSKGNFIIGFGDQDFYKEDKSGYYFNGAIDDVAIYNRALSDAEVLQLFQQTITKY